MIPAQQFPILQCLAIGSGPRKTLVDFVVPAWALFRLIVVPGYSSAGSLLGCLRLADCVFRGWALRGKGPAAVPSEVFETFERKLTRSSSSPLLRVEP